ncbi:hypothetical protein B0H14DRAFT_2563288 [Mycena olivaceomarginata]|nr:hypothetical protein B0H14DRAFT_2563288 [Mycena olivaceomarginata]
MPGFFTILIFKLNCRRHLGSSLLLSIFGAVKVSAPTLLLRCTGLRELPANLLHKIGHFTMDNASNHQTFMQCLERLLAERHIIDFCANNEYIRCFTHIVNLCSQACIKAMEADDDTSLQYPDTDTDSDRSRDELLPEQCLQFKGEDGQGRRREMRPVISVKYAGGCHAAKTKLRVDQLMSHMGFSAVKLNCAEEIRRRDEEQESESRKGSIAAQLDDC